MKHKRMITVLIILSIIGLIIISGCSKKTTTDYQNIGEITMYKAPTCGCCNVYAQYLKRNDISVNLNEVSDVAPYKDEAGIPANMRSCHTSKVGNYFVEGHVPLEAIEKMMKEKPDIKGIMMPGMPSGSPGMPGSKQGTWTIYALQNDGSVTEFMNM